LVVDVSAPLLNERISPAVMEDAPVMPVPDLATVTEPISL